MKQKHALILSLILTVLIASNLFVLQNLTKEERTLAQVERIIDGDTLVLKTGETIRLVNINSPERGKPGYEEATFFLKQIENKTIEIESLGFDKYGRTLARAHTKDYINLEIVKQGFANKYLVRKEELSVFAQAEEIAIKEEKGIWKKSEFFDCLQTQIQKETLELTNTCETLQTKSWRLKDESRKEYNFPDLFIEENEALEIKPEIPSLQEEPNSIYIFDEEGNLVHYHPFGY